MTTRAWWHRLFGLLAIACLAGSLWAAALVICPKCGWEADVSAATCPHCGAVLPVVKGEPTAPTNAIADIATNDAAIAVNDVITTVTASAATTKAVAVDKQPAAVSDMALEMARIDKRLADENLTNNRPEVSYAYYANAVALSRLIKREGISADAGKSLAQNLERCRGLLSHTTRPCPACNGLGVRSIQFQPLAGDKSAQANMSLPLSENSPCPSCGGGGVVSAGRSANELRVLIAQGWRDFETRQQAFGYVACGRVWIQPDLLPLLNAKAQALIRTACPTPCPACMGLGIQDCSRCKGIGRVKCNNEGCVNGWILTAGANSLAPKNALKHKDRCPVCQGSGFMPCPDCLGIGTVPCKSCNGTGHNAVCPECGGPGWESCPKCHGAGIVGSASCPVCHGEKVVLCPKCHGEGCSTR